MRPRKPTYGLWQLYEKLVKSDLRIQTNFDFSIQDKHMQRVTKPVYALENSLFKTLRVLCDKP